MFDGKWDKSFSWLNFSYLEIHEKWQSWFIWFLLCAIGCFSVYWLHVVGGVELICIELWKLWISKLEKVASLIYWFLYLCQTNRKLFAQTFIFGADSNLILDLFMWIIDWVHMIVIHKIHYHSMKHFILVFQGSNKTVTQCCNMVLSLCWDTVLSTLLSRDAVAQYCHTLLS